KRALPSTIVLAMASTNDGSVYVSTADSGLFRWLPNGSLRQVGGSRFVGDRNAVRAIAVDSLTNSVWLGGGDGGLVQLVDDQTRATYSAVDGLAPGGVSDVRLASDGSLWVTAEGGVSHVRDGRVATLTQASGLPCTAAHWAIEDDDHSLWVY